MIIISILAHLAMFLFLESDLSAVLFVIISKINNVMFIKFVKY